MTKYPYVTEEESGCASQWRVALGPNDETWIIDAITKADALQIAQARTELRSCNRLCKELRLCLAQCVDAMTKKASEQERNCAIRCAKAVLTA